MVEFVMESEKGGCIVTLGSGSCIKDQEYQIYTVQPGDTLYKIARIMGYDFHWFSSEAGPIAPADWIDRVLAYAVSSIPNDKIVLGVPTYGYDWPLGPGQEGRGITYSYAISTAKRYNALIIEDAQQGPHFTYTLNEAVHEVWFSDATSLATLLDLVNKYDIKGIVFWYLGAEDPKIYDVIRTKFQASV